MYSAALNATYIAIWDVAACATRTLRVMEI